MGFCVVTFTARDQSRRSLRSRHRNVEPGKSTLKSCLCFPSKTWRRTGYVSSRCGREDPPPETYSLRQTETMGMFTRQNTVSNVYYFRTTHHRKLLVIHSSLNGPAMQCSYGSDSHAQWSRYRQIEGIYVRQVTNEVKHMFRFTSSRH